MPRFSIMSDQRRFDNAIRDIYPLFAMDKNSETIVERVKDKYQEKEIYQLLQWFSEIPGIPNTKPLSIILKITLWLLLLFKIFGVFSFVTAEQLSLSLIVIAILLGPLINIGALTFAYKGGANNYIWVLALLLIGSSSSRNEFEVLFEEDILSLPWFLVCIAVVSFLLALFTSWRLHRVHNSGRSRTKDALERLGFQIQGSK